MPKITPKIPEATYALVLAQSPPTPRGAPATLTGKREMRMFPDGVTHRRVIWVLGACLAAGLVALGAVLGSHALAASVAVKSTVQRMSEAEAAHLPHPIYCSPGGFSGPSFSDAADFKHAAPPQDCMTLGVSFRSTYLGDYQVIVGWESDRHHFASMQLRLSETGNLEYGEFAHSWNSIKVLPQANFADGSWHTAVVVRNGSSSAYAEGALLVSLYVDGKLAGRGVLPKRRPEHLLRGARSARPGPRHQDHVLQGSVHDLRIYGQALGHRQWSLVAKDPCPRSVLETEAIKIAASLL